MGPLVRFLPTVFSDMAIHNPFEFWGPLVRFLPTVFSDMAIHNPFEFWGPLVRFLPQVSHSTPSGLAL
ncbi:MAG: hypothetical protein DRR08_33040 [Candidatus Parabeggiatoa sp. nov. 2]|nr:MAG: hypothetical protein DRR08_33040 [Gammaproteobacteria bacterium]